MPVRSPIDPDGARRILAYDRAVFDRFARRVRRLPKREAFENREIGHLSLFGTLVHILNVKDAWLNYIVPGRVAVFSVIHAEPARHPEDWGAFDRYYPRVWGGIDHFARGLSDRSLGKLVKAPWMPGRYTAGDAVLQQSFEQAHHLGEIIGALWQRDRAPPEMTWIDTHRQLGRPRGRR